MNAKELQNYNLAEYKKARDKAKLLEEERSELFEKVKKIAKQKDDLHKEINQINIRIAELKTEIHSESQKADQYSLYPKCVILFEAAKSYIPISDRKEFGHKVTRLLDEMTDRGELY